MLYLVLTYFVRGDKIWLLYLVRTEYGSRILSPWTKCGWSPLAIFCPVIITPGPTLSRTMYFVLDRTFILPAILRPINFHMKLYV